MDDQKQKLEQAILALNVIEGSFTGDNVDGATVLSNIDTYVSSLRNLHDSGNASYFEIPVDLLRFIDESDVTNPELYMHKLMSECENASSAYAKRYVHIKAAVSENNLKRKR